MSYTASDLRRSNGERVPTYRSRLHRRVYGACGLVVLIIAAIIVALTTVWGQGVDTLMMEAMTVRLVPLHTWHEASTGLVSLMNIVVATLLVGGIAVARRRATLAARAVAIIVVSNLITQALKWVLVRPDLGLTYVFPNSLPSGHVTVAASLAVSMVVVSPYYLRSVVAWAGWAWVAFMGVMVMAQSWHRLSDVVVSIMIVGACALVLTPIESDERHFRIGHRVMTVVVLLCLCIALSASLVTLWGLDVQAASHLSGGGYGFADYVHERPRRANLLALAGALWVTGVAGVVIHEVDRLRWPLHRGAARLFR